MYQPSAAPVAPVAQTTLMENAVLPYHNHRIVKKGRFLQPKASFSRPPILQ
jgi:hypothetical protein